MTDELKEKLAACAHKMWGGWMDYLFYKSHQNGDGSVTIPDVLVERWKRQARTTYANLPEEEKESDREEADYILQVINSE